ncbi:hypothetical protein B484DRAFT_148639 [Ochromonadaceae sp. CCMP2298]|nr:hypothetical protein B484DRAFT_148639 [Ochromonadaceae sp. CCMP2298]
MSEKAEFRVPDEVSSSADGNFLVDIVRVEDGRLMETLVLSEKTFPPRVNKKGKVLWQLPKAGVATLGAVEKERCMCMFRDLRKDRKKQRARVEEVSKPKKLSRGPPAVSTPAVNPLAVNTRGRDLVGAANTLANTPNTPANTPGNPLEMRAKETWKAEWKSSFLSRLEEKAEKAWEEHLDAGASKIGDRPVL